MTSLEYYPEEPFQPPHLLDVETLRELHEVPNSPRSPEQVAQLPPQEITPHAGVGDDAGAEDDLDDLPPIAETTSPVPPPEKMLGSVATQFVTPSNNTTEPRQESPGTDIAEPIPETVLPEYPIKPPMAATEAPESVQEVEDIAPDTLQPTEEPLPANPTPELEETTDHPENTGVSGPQESLLLEPPILPPPLDIRRTEKHIILASTTHPNRELAAEVADTLHDGIPKSWPKFDNGTGTSKYYVDNAESPSIIIKIKGDVDTLKNTIRNAETSPHAPARIAGERTRLSVVNEMRLGLRVSDILQQEEPQQLARDAGFEGVDVVQPLASVINADTGQRATVYAWSPGESVAVINQKAWESTPPLSSAREAHNAFMGNLEHLTYELSDHLRTHGIDARDLKPHNVIIENKDGKLHVHIIDIELYRRIRQSA